MDCATIIMINTMINKGSIIWVRQMKVVWEPRVIIDKRGLFSFVVISDVDLTDATGRLTIHVTSGLYFYLAKVFTLRCSSLHSDERHIKSHKLSFFSLPRLLELLFKGQSL